MAVNPVLHERTKEDWLQRAREVREYNRATPQRINQLLIALAQVDGHSSMNQLQHSLQTATRAQRSGASEEMIVAALCHDVAKLVSTENHAAVCAEILKPFVDRTTYDIIRTHTEFAARHFNMHNKYFRDPRDKYRLQPWFSTACQFADEWDLLARDPSYDTYPLQYFWPLLEKTFSAPKVQSSSSSRLTNLLLALTSSIRRLFSRSG